MAALTIAEQAVYGLPRFKTLNPYDTQLRKLSSGLVHRWMFNETSGNFADYVNGLTLTASGSFVYGVAAPAGGAVTFGASAKGVSSGLGLLPTGAGARTVLALYRANTAAKECLASWGPTGSASRWWACDQEELDTWANDLSFTGLPANHWHLYAAYYEGSGTGVGGVVLDGVRTTKSFGTLNTGSSGNFQTGLSTNNDAQFTGTLDDLAIFSRALSTTEIALLYTAAQASPANWY